MLALKTSVKVETLDGVKYGAIVGRSYWKQPYYDIRVGAEILANVPAEQVRANVRDDLWSALT